MPAAVASEKFARRQVLVGRARLALGVAAVALLFGWKWWTTVSHTPILNVPPSHVPAHNAYVLYTKAQRLAVDSEVLSLYPVRGQRSQRATLDQCKNVLDKNRAALESLRVGLTLEYVPQPLPLEEQYVVYRFDVLRRLLELDSWICASSADWDGAANAMLDQIAFTESLMHGGGTRSVTESAYSRMLSYGVVSDPIDHLTATQIRSAIGRLNSIVDHRPTFEQILVDEKWLDVRLMDEALSDPHWRDQVSSGRSNVVMAPGRFGQWGRQAQMLTMDKRQAMLAFAKHMDDCAMLAKAKGGNIPKYPAPPSDPVNQQFGADIAGAHHRWAITAADDARLLLRLALRLYRLEHGAYPANLQSLCPDYLTTVPENPLGGASGFAYHQSVKDYVLTTPPIPVVQQILGYPTDFSRY